MEVVFYGLCVVVVLWSMAMSCDSLSVIFFCNLINII